MRRMISTNPMPTNDWQPAFCKLLAANAPEQSYQDFLEKHPFLIPRQFVQHHGIHLKLVLSKVSFGSDWKCDFLYLSKSSRDWHCVLVEIEKPWSRYFKDGSNELHRDFTSANDQIMRWRSWFAQDGNRLGFLTSLRFVQSDSWASNPTYFKYVLVHGRSAEHEHDPGRRQRLSAYERDDFKIVSYDSLLSGTNQSTDLYVGVKKNDHVKIVSTRFVDEAIFSWIAPQRLRITQALQSDILRNRGKWFHRTTEEGYEYVLDHRLSEVPVEPEGR